MSNIRKLVLDVAKPMDPDIIEVAKALSEIEGSSGVNISVMEVEREIENVRVTVIGPKLNTKEIFKSVKKFGGAIHSIDEVATGEEVVEHAVILEGH